MKKKIIDSSVHYRTRFAVKCHPQKFNVDYEEPIVKH